MRLIILGQPGAGKGTYSSKLGSRLKIAKISTGDMLREQMKKRTDLGKKISVYMNRGKLVPSEIVLETLKRRLGWLDCEKGFIIEGYPRTIEQAKSLEKIAKIDAIISIKIPRSIIVKRLANRITCSKCGAVYNTQYLKSKKAGVCDICKGKLVRRQDDKPEVVKQRFRVYKIETRPLIDYYIRKIPFVEIAVKSIETPPEVIVEKILLELEHLGLIK